MILQIAHVNGADPASTFDHIKHVFADAGFVVSGIDTKRLDEVAKMAIKDPSAGGNPIQFTEKQYKALARKCVTGDL